MKHLFQTMQAMVLILSNIIASLLPYVLVNAKKSLLPFQFRILLHLHWVLYLQKLHEIANK